MMAPESEDSEDCSRIVLTCCGNIDDPNLNSRLSDITRCLQTLTAANRRPQVTCIEPWNSVRVTLKVSRETAALLHQLAQSRDSTTLADIGVLSVQVDGGNIVHLDREPPAESNSAKVNPVVHCQRNTETRLSGTEVAGALCSDVRHPPVNTFDRSWLADSNDGGLLSSSRTSAFDPCRNVGLTSPVSSGKSGSGNRSWHPLAGQHTPPTLPTHESSSAASCSWDSPWNYNGIATDPFQFSADDLLTRMLADVPAPKRRHRVRKDAASAASASSAGSSAHLSPQLSNTEPAVKSENIFEPFLFSTCSAEVLSASHTASSLQQQQPPTDYFSSLERTFSDPPKRINDSPMLYAAATNNCLMPRERRRTSDAANDRPGLAGNNLLQDVTKVPMPAGSNLASIGPMLLDQPPPVKRRRVNSRNSSRGPRSADSSRIASYPDVTGCTSAAAVFDPAFDRPLPGSRSEFYSPVKQTSVDPHAARLWSSPPRFPATSSYSPGDGYYSRSTYPESCVGRGSEMNPYVYRHASVPVPPSCMAGHVSRSPSVNASSSTSAGFDSTMQSVVYPGLCDASYSSRCSPCDPQSTSIRWQSPRSTTTVLHSSPTAAVGSATCTANDTERMPFSNPKLPAESSDSNRNALPSDVVTATEASLQDARTDDVATAEDKMPATAAHEFSVEQNAAPTSSVLASAVAAGTFAVSPHEAWTGSDSDYFGVSGTDSGVASNTSLSVGSDHSENDRMCLEMPGSETVQQGISSALKHSPKTTEQATLSSSVAFAGGVDRHMPLFSTALHGSVDAPAKSVSSISSACVQGLTLTNSSNSAGQNGDNCSSQTTKAVHVVDGNKTTTTERLRMDARMRFARRSRQTPSLVPECPPAITCPSLPRRLSESVKRAMRGGGGAPPDPPMPQAALCDATPAKVVIRITKTRCSTDVGSGEARRSKQKEQWCVQPILKPLQPPATLAMADVTAKQSSEASLFMAASAESVGGFQSAAATNMDSLYSSPASKPATKTPRRRQQCSRQTVPVFDQAIDNYTSVAYHGGLTMVEGRSLPLGVLTVADGLNSVSGGEVGISYVKSTPEFCVETLNNCSSQDVAGYSGEKQPESGLTVPAENVIESTTKTVQEVVTWP